MVVVRCLVNDKPAKDAFYVEVDRSATVGRLKVAIKEKESAFKNIDAHKLEVWCAHLAPPRPKAVLDPRTPLHSIYPNGQGQGDYIIVQSTSVDTPVSSTPLPGYLETPTALKRKHEHELEDLQKLQRVSDWVEYDAKDGSIDLPPVLISMLDNGEFTPAPRNEFKQLLGDMKVGQEITLPSIGQQPKHYGEGYQELSFLITEQMLEMWHLLSSDSSRPIRRVLSGPMGVGKSYLALFLAAKAYAEGWLLLYVSDANVLALEDTAMIAAEICKRFLDLNKDILTVDDLRKMTFGHLTGDGALIRAATVILHTLLQQRRTKTLLVIDEHGALFEQNPPVPIKHALLNPLMKLGAWKETSAGTRVVLVGTAHARFEMEYVKSDMWNWLEYVGPLSDTVFDKLLDMNPILSGTMIREQVKETTNRVPRELIKMAESVSAECGIPGRHIDENMDQVIPSLINQFNKKRRDTFFREASTYFNRLKDLQRHPYRCALSAMFLPRKEDDFDCEEKGFDYEFLDLGLVYRTKVGSRTKYSFLSPAAKDALLDLYKSMPLPRHAAI
ncbi:MAG: hypothetical protein J3Q66DRAFT_334266 [Benniella sp.]|nr:MAG: hypothetical protein J3Q66DRAFT_334266 [Benniella sp.]